MNWDFVTNFEKNKTKEADGWEIDNTFKYIYWNLQSCSVTGLLHSVKSYKPKKSQKTLKENLKNATCNSKSYIVKFKIHKLFISYAYK